MQAGKIKFERGANVLVQQVFVVGQRWGRLTEPDLEDIPVEKISRKMQERCGAPKENDERQVHTWFKIVMKGCHDGDQADRC